MLNRLDLDEKNLTHQAKIVYNYVYDTLYEEAKVVDFGLDINIEGYFHTDTTNFVLPKDWIYTYEDRKPLLDITLDTSLGEHFYGYSSLPVTATRFEIANNSVGPITNLYGKSAITSNIFLLYPLENGKGGFLRLDFSIPYRAFGAVGGDGWSVQIGREQLSWGPGKNGNFVLGDHLSYHNVGRFTAYEKNFKYTFLTSFFPHPSEYYSSTPVLPYSGYIDYTTDQIYVTSGLNMFLAHRLEWNMFSHKLNFTLTETIMYQSADNTLDLRILSPTAIFHNYYIRSNANSLLALEVDVTPIKHLNIYGQIAIDEFVLPGEPVNGTNGSLPTAIGYMVGAQGNYPVLNGFLYGSFEWAQTDPYLYLRDNNSYEQSPGEYGINYVVAIREKMSELVYYQEEFLGYKYGGDAIVLNGQFVYKDFGTWHATANLFYMMHGTFDKWTLWAAESGGNGSSLETTPTTEHKPGNNLDSYVSDRDSVEKTLVIGLQGGYTILSGLDVFGQVDFVHITNPGNVSTNPARSDVQITVGVSYHL
ncbi:MAG: hypothetical protein EOM67_02410 [Spirochaetia bacterium]|nr:hypothetical protein [Spirochaetia bacterium]